MRRKHVRYTQRYVKGFCDIARVVQTRRATMDRSKAEMSTKGGSAALDPYAEMREEMVETQLRRRGVKDIAVLKAMATVPRHEFVPAVFKDLAYRDEPLAIGEGQTISQPYIVAAMTEALCLTGNERVLDVGTGCGYQAAVLAELAGEVHSIELRPSLAKAASERLHALGFTRVHVHCGDGTLGLQEFAPFDAILVAAAAPRVPQALLEQMSEGARLIAPLGTPEQQRLILIRKHGSEYATEQREACRFVPLLGEYGWRDQERL